MGGDGARLPCVASGSWILLHYHNRVQKDGSENSQEILSIFDGYQQSQKHRNGQKNHWVVSLWVTFYHTRQSELASS